jgi:hypothetical protein
VASLALSSRMKAMRNGASQAMELIESVIKRRLN